MMVKLVVSEMRRQEAMIERFVGEVLNIFLHVVHLGVIVFSMVGWMFVSTRLATLILLLAILTSWYVLGPILGKGGVYGYCLVTDIQWRLKKKLGHNVPASGYIKYLIDTLTGGNVDDILVDRVTAAVFFFSCGACIILLLLHSL